MTTEFKNIVYDIDKAKDYIKFSIPKAVYNDIYEIAKNIAKHKNEKQYANDNRSLINRYLTGLLGEYAVSKVLNIPIVDKTVGNNIQYNNPDIMFNRLNKYKGVGIKTVVNGNFPLIFKNNDYPQIIAFRDIKNTEEDENDIYICGMAQPSVLNNRKNQNDYFILDSRLRARGTKTAFVGFNDDGFRIISNKCKETFTKWKNEGLIMNCNKELQENYYY